MEPLFSTLWIALTAVYVVAVSRILIGLCRLQPGRSQILRSVSVIVAARNEEQHLRRCLNALISQSYPPELVEIVVVDDRSEDGTARIVRDAQTRCDRIKLVQVKALLPGLTGKKNALTQGIQQSHGEILCITDADCRPGPDWIAGMLRHFEDGVGMVAGYSPFETRGGLVQRLLAFETMVTATMAAGSIGWGGGITCAARDLSYRRALFDQVGGFSKIGHVRSGDDTLLLQQVKRETTWKVRYATEPETFVWTDPPPNLKTFVQQRVRHLSTGRLFSKPLRLLGGGIYLFDLLLIITVPLALIGHIGPTPLMAFGVKASVDFAAMWRSSGLFRGRGLLSLFPLMEVLYPPYIVLFGALGMWKNFKWKE